MRATRQLFRLFREITSQRLINQRNCFLNTIQRNKASEPRPLGGAKQHLIERGKPSAQRIKPVPANGIYDGLQAFIIARTGVIAKRGSQSL